MNVVHEDSTRHLFAQKQVAWVWLVFIFFSPSLVLPQAYYVNAEFPNLSVPYNPPNGITFTEEIGNHGRVLDFFWGYVSTGWRDMRFTFTAPDGSQLVQVAGQPNSEVTGPAFDPSGTRLYFSSQWGATGRGRDGITYEVSGPFNA